MKKENPSIENITQDPNFQENNIFSELDDDQSSSQKDMPEISHGRYRRGSDTEDEISGNNEDLLNLIRKKSPIRELENALRNKGVNVDYQNIEEDTPLHVAVRKGYKDAVDLLINKGADVSIRNKKSKTALELSKERLIKTPNDLNWQSIKTLLEQVQPSTSSIIVPGTKRPGNGTGGPAPKNPRIDPALDPDPTYVASGVKRALDGTIYQSKLLGLFTKRAIDKRHDFRLATEMDAAEKFDDVVIKYQDQGKWTYRFLQAKHKQNPQRDKITVNELKTEQDGNFSLQKYFVSYCKIKKNPLFQGGDFKDFSIATNTDFDFDINRKYKKDGQERKDSKERNDLIEQWKNFFEFENLSNADEILYFGKGEKTGQFKRDAQTIAAIEKEIQSALEKNIQEIDKSLKVKFNKALDDELKILKETIDNTNNNFTTNIHDFLKILTFITNYPSEKELGGLIKGELGEEFHLLNADLVSDSFEREMLDFLKSYDKGKAKFYSWKDGENFFKALKGKIKTLMTSGLSKAYPEELRAYGIDFEKNLEELGGFLSGKNQILHLKTQGTELSAIKVLETLKSDAFKSTYNYLGKEDGYIFMPLKPLLREGTQDLVIKSFSSHQSHHLLVIECQAKTQGEANEIGQLSQKLSTALSHSNKKIILVAQDQDVLADKFKGSNKYITLKDDKISFEDLSADSQKKILEKKVNFQGKDLSLNGLIDKTSAVEIIDHASLSRLLQEEKVQIGNEKAFSSIGYVPDYYIERSLHRQGIKAQVLKEKIESGLFFITGASDKSDLTGLGVEEKFIHLWADGQTYENGIILSASGQNHQEIFEKLSEEHSGKSIHWLEYQEGNLFWRDFTGSLSAVREYIEDNIPDRKNALEEGHLSNPEKPKDKIVILANDPGEGKSTVLTSLARKMKEQSATQWVVRVDLNDYAEKGRENSLEKINFDENDVRSAIDFVSKMAVSESSEHSLERKLFTRVLERGDAHGSDSKIVIFFDGFDEISPTYKEKTIGLLKALKGSHLAQLWVTTRFHEKTELEGQLESTAYLLNPLTREEQGAFLDKFWSCYHEEENIGSTSQGDSHKRWLKEWIKSIGNRNREFNLVPLNLKMLAEVVLEKGSQLPEKLKLPELYDSFIKAKFGIYHQDKSRVPQGNVGGDDIIKRDLENLNKAHRELALKHFFPGKSLPGLGEQSQFKNEELARVGLLALKGDQLEFIHPSFAEYFLSEYLIKNLEDDRIGNLLLEEILLKENYKLTRTFFNSELLKNSSSPIISNKSPAKTYHQDEDIVVLREFDKEPLLNKLVLENHLGIINHLIDKYPNHCQKLMLETDSFEQSVLHLAAYEGHHEPIKALLELIKDDQHILKELILKGDTQDRTALHWAAQEGYDEPIKALLELIKNDQHILKELILKRDVDGQTASHWAAQEGYDKAYNTIGEFVKNHSNISNELMQIKNNNGKTISEVNICV